MLWSSISPRLNVCTSIQRWWSKFGYCVLFFYYYTLDLLLSLFYRRSYLFIALFLCHFYPDKWCDICFVSGGEERLYDKEGGRAVGRFIEVGIQESKSGR